MAEEPSLQMAKRIHKVQSHHSVHKQNDHVMLLLETIKYTQNSIYIGCMLVRIIYYLL